MTATAEAPAVNGNAPRPGAAVALRRDPLPAKIEYARELANSGLLPAAFRRNPANVLFAVEYGDMLGLPPMAAITGIHVIEGKPSASAGLISALVRRAGHKLRVTGDAKSATCQIVRSDDPDYTFSVTWTIDDAKTAGLTGKDVWKKYPASMLKSRSITQCARDACEEALYGLHYTPEELGAEVDEEGRVYGGTLEGEGAPQQPSGTRDGGTDAERPAEDEQWAQDAIATAGSFTTPKDGQDLWAEVMARNDDGSGRITAEERELISGLMKARIQDLRKPQEPAEAEIADAEIVPDGLDPEDEWAAKVADIQDYDDAVAASADVSKGMQAGHIAKERGEVIIAAIEARLATLSGAAA